MGCLQEEVFSDAEGGYVAPPEGAARSSRGERGRLCCALHMRHAMCSSA